MFNKDRKTDGPLKEAKSSETGGKGAWFKENQRSIIAVGLIMIMAFVMRFIFSFGVSADSAFALSGGATASGHLHTVTEILTNGSFFGPDGSLNYPFGSVNTDPVFLDVILALFAMIYKACGLATIEAASLSLGLFSVICGTLAIIPMFLLGKEVVGTKKAGFVAALFLAFCPIVITQTVFSNGTETGWILFLFLILSLLMFKGVKEINVYTKTDDSFKDVIKANRSALRISAIAGLVLAAIVLSTSEFRPVFTLLIIAMAIMTVIGRFQYRDVRMVASFFSVTILIGIAVAAAYYIPAQLMDQVLSGILVASLLSVAICISFAVLQTKPWVITVPSYLVGVIVLFAILSVFAPGFYADLVYGNSIYADSVASLVGSSLSISHLSADFGVVTMWLSILVIGLMIWGLPKKIASLSYQFLLVFMIVSAILCAKSSFLAAVFSPVYALCFAYIIMWIFDHVDFKTYFLSIKNAGLKNSWKKVLKPVPFATILAVAFLLCVPIAMYAVDASISSNSAKDYDGMDLGATSYYVKTDSDWVVGPVLSSYSDVNKTGALVTWIDYADDSSTYGKFDVIVDSNANGAEAASNILLSDAVDGSSTASMIIYLLTYSGLGDNVKTALTGAGLSDEDFTTISELMSNPSKFREDIVGDLDKYGILRTDISDENIKYVYGKTLLTDNYNAYQIASMYSAVAAASGKNISYFMVDGNMFPMYFGGASLFSTMGYVNGYTITDSYGTVAEFLTASYYSQVYGIYEYKESMFNTLLWRSYIGMSPAEAKVGSDAYAAYTYFNYLTRSDGTYKAQPGYGLSNYEVDYDHWYVMYNPSSDAAVNDDGWVKMLYADAIAKQDAEAGLINYLSGLPVFMKYVSNSSGSSLTGHVISAGAGVSGIRVSVVDAEGTIRSTAFTDSNGEYTVLVSGDNPQIKFYAGSQNLTDGSLISTVDYEGAAIDVEIPATAAEGVFVDSDGTPVDMSAATLTLTGQVSGEVYSSVDANLELDVDGFKLSDAVPDIYTVSLKSGDVSYVSDKTITVNKGDNKGIEVSLDVNTVTLNFVDDAGAPLPKNVVVQIHDLATGVMYNESTDGNGVIETQMINGTYSCEFTADYITSSAPFTVSGAAASNTIKAHKFVSTEFTGFPGNKMITIYTTGYQTSAKTNDAGTVTVKLPAGTGGALVYTAYAVDGGNCYMAKSDDTEAKPGNITVTGTMKNPSSEVTSGTILFISSDGYQIPVSVASDGTYSVVLKTGTYTIYANKGSYVSWENVEFTETIAHDITLASGKKISGYTYWGPYDTSVNTMSFVPVTVSEITDCASCGFVAVSDNAGAYSFYIPSNSTCKLVATCKDPYYYEDGDTHVTTKTKTEVSSTADFVARAGKINVTNSSSYDITVDGTTIAKDANADITVSSTTWAVKISDNEAGYYSTKNVRSSPSMDAVIITDATFDGKQYYTYTINVPSETDTVTIQALDDEAGDKIAKTSSGTARQYYLENGKKFMFTIKNSDSTKIMYVTYTVSEKKEINATLSDVATVTGFVGKSDTGIMRVTYTDTAEYFDFTITAGRYSVPLPVDKNMTLTAKIENASADVTYNYEASRDIAASSMTAGNTYTYNLAVSSIASGAGTDKVTATMTIDGMTDAAIADVEFTVNFSKTELSEMTYVLSGGTAWSNVKFYSDLARTNEISTITFSNTYTVYGLGTVVKNNVAFASDNLSVILTDINGNAACTAKVTGDDTLWSKTTATADTTKIDTTVNTVGDSEYMYTLKIVNDDNFTKRFVLSAAGISGESWYVRYVYDKTINTDGVIYVKGYTTAIAYVKITNIGGEVIPEVPAEVTITVSATGSNGLTTDTASTVTIDGNTATAKSTSSNSTITVQGSDASGRGALNAKSDMPTYVWILIALIVAMVFLIIWMASKRGVFSRRK